MYSICIYMCVHIHMNVYYARMYMYTYIFYTHIHKYIHLYLYLYLNTFSGYFRLLILNFTTKIIHKSVFSPGCSYLSFPVSRLPHIWRREKNDNPVVQSLRKYTSSNVCTLFHQGGKKRKPNTTTITGLWSDRYIPRKTLRNNIRGLLQSARTPMTSVTERTASIVGV